MVDISNIKGKKDGEKAPKVVKFKLSKEQSAFIDEFVKLDNRIAVCREYIALWANFFRIFVDVDPKKDITPEEEKAFFQISTVLARKHFQFVELMGDCFDKGGDIINLMAGATSLAVIQSLQEQTRGKLDLDWHTLYLEMNKGLGRLLRLMPGTMTLSEALAAVEKAKIAPVTAAPAPAPAAPVAAAKK